MKINKLNCTASSDLDNFEPENTAKACRSYTGPWLSTNLYDADLL